jgi:hypothetical protein
MGTGKRKRCMRGMRWPSVLPLVSPFEAGPSTVWDLSRFDIGSPFSRGSGAYAQSLRRKRTCPADRVRV